MSKTLLSTVVPPSIRSLLSLAPFVLSSELARGPDVAIVIQTNDFSYCICTEKKNRIINRLPNWFPVFIRV